MSDLTSQYIIAQEEHDYNKKYEEGTIVKHTIDNVTTAYAAKKNVPRFVSILNENYWKKIASTASSGGGGVDIFDEDVEATDTQRNKALANVSNQTANNSTGKMGYKVLDPTKTFAEQVTAENTIYEIRDVFDLGDGSVTIPTNCTLKFAGGKIKNGTIIGDKFYVNSTDVCFINIIFNENTNISMIDTIWFEIKPIVDNAPILNSIFAANCKNIIIRKYNFNIMVQAPSSLDSENQRPTILIKNGGKTLDFNNNIIQLIANDYTKYSIIEPRCNDFTIKNLKIIGDLETHTGSTGEWGHGIHLRKCNNIIIDNVVVEKCWGDGFDFIDYTISELEGYYPSNIQVINCKSLRNRRNGFSVEAGRNISLKGCEIAYTGTINGTAPKRGFGIEPWHKTEFAKVINVTIDGCNIHDNALAELYLGALNASYDIYESGTFVKNTIINNTSTSSVVIIKGDLKGTFFENCTIGNSNFGYEFQANYGTLSIKDSIIYGRVDCRHSNFVLDNCKYNYLYNATYNSQGMFYLLSCTTSIINSTILNAINSRFYANSLSEDEKSYLIFENNTIIANNNSLFDIWGGSDGAQEYDIVFKNNTLKNVVALFGINSNGNVMKVYIDELPILVNLYTYGSFGNVTIDYRHHGNTASRPVFTSNTNKGFQYFDETLSKYICWNGTAWVNLDGTALS